MTSTNRDIITETKNRLDIVDVIGEEIELQDEGNGHFVGSVPPVGHSGKSLKVDQNLQLWHDMKNGDGGDVLDWIGRSFSDPRGRDFPDVLRIAAERAGIELTEITVEEKERVEVYDFLTAMAEIYHQNLTPDLYSIIEKKWGISKETVDSLKIGYATVGGRDMQELDQGMLLKSGLVYANMENIFDGRIIFPYRKNGKVVYMIGRSTGKTPRGKGGSDPAKYLKLLVNSEKYPEVIVTNSYFYGEDSLRSADYCIITEGVTDCIVTLQAGFPCISPATVRFRDEDHPKLIELTKGLKHVYICNDNEENEAGIKGALKTAEALEQAGIEARIIELPRPEGSTKIDIAEYMKTHKPYDFNKLINSSVRLWNYKLNKQFIPATKLDKRKAFEDFITNDLNGMSYADWDVFVNNDVVKYFGLAKKDVKSTVDKTRGLVREIYYDLDSVSGRNAIYRAFADEYISEHHVKCINDKLRLYKDGIYPESDEAIRFIQTEIMNIGLSHGVNLAENNITAILKVIELSTRVRIVDCEPNSDSVIVVNNGILHLDTWELEEFSPDKIYFSKMPVDYNKDAPKPTKFYNYIDTCFKGNEEQKDLLQELFGYSLLKNYKYQNIFYLLGPGGNGKGIALSILGYLLGEHNCASESLYQLTDHSQIDYHIAKLHGKHANICGDISAKTMINTETIKKLTSNTDPVTARNPYEKPFSFVNYAKIIVALNRLPQTDAFTTGDKRRNLIISFNNKFSETDDEIKGIQCVIRDAGEMPGILLWAIEGLKRLEANQKFSDSRTIAQRAVEYDRKSRPVKYYVEERLEEDYGSVVPNAVIYEDFNRFCVENGAAELSQEEIKKSILQECSEAGWKVTNILDRVSSVPDSIWEYIEKNELKQERIRCFHGIRIVRPTVAKNKHQNEATTDLLRSDMKNLVRSHYNSVVENVPAMVEDFNKKYPGFVKTIGYDTILTIAEQMNNWGWDQN